MRTTEEVINEYEQKGVKYSNVFVRTEIFTRASTIHLMKAYASELIDEFVKCIEQVKNNNQLFIVYATSERKQNVSRLAIKLFKEKNLK